MLARLSTTVRSAVRATRSLVIKEYDFDKSNPLGEGGERVDILMTEAVNFKKLDLYQKSHYMRYLFACGQIAGGDVCGDFACGTGYGSLMMSDKASFVIGADISTKVIHEITRRYQHRDNVSFFSSDILALSFSSYFDAIVSFETLEHLSPQNIADALAVFHRALKPGGKLIFSVPYMQKRCENAIKLGFHQTFDIDEIEIHRWLSLAGYDICSLHYQNYKTHDIAEHLSEKDFIICTAKKVAE